MTEHRVKVLIIDEEAAFLEEAVTELSGHFTVYTSATGGDGLKLFADLRPQVVIVDAGISDIPFPDLLDHLKGLDGAVLRIATSHDYSAIEKVVQAIDTAHIHKYFRKPVNYIDLVESINARTVNYQVGRGILQGADISPAYDKLHNIVEKAKEVEKLRQQLESQMAKVRDVEAESFNKIKDALGEVDAFRKKVADKEALISSLQAKSLELEELKKRDIDRVERERAALRQELKGLQDECEKLLREKDELSHVKSDNETFRKETEKLRAENSDLRVSVARERKMMIEEMAQQRRTVEEELARKKDEAERAIELQKERNKAELQALQDAFKEEQQRAAWFEIDRLKAELEADRKAKLAEIEVDRKRVEEEFVEIRARMSEEKKQLEKSIQELREKAEAEVQRIRESAAKEREKLTRELEVTLTEMKKAAAAEVKDLKASATRELDRLKAAADKKERELSEALIQARRMAGETEERLKLTEGRIEALESEIEKKIHEKDLILRELESVRADFTVAIQSREALLVELAEVSNRPK